MIQRKPGARSVWDHSPSQNHWLFSNRNTLISNTNITERPKTSKTITYLFLFCPLLDKDKSIVNLYIALSCPIK